jgi:hypothetical protein
MSRTDERKVWEGWVWSQRCGCFQCRAFGERCEEALRGSNPRLIERALALTGRQA